MKNRTHRFLVLAIVAAPLLGCAKAEEPPPGFTTKPLAPGQVLTTRATVRFSKVEGGCWALQTAAGVYKPLELPQPYQIDGLPVRITIRGAPDYADFCMIAPLVHLDSIVGILENAVSGTGVHAP